MSGWPRAMSQTKEIIKWKRLLNVNFIISQLQSRSQVLENFVFSHIFPLTTPVRSMLTKHFQQGPFEILKFSLVARLREHKQRKLNKHVYSSFCLCHLSLVIKLNFNISKGPYWHMSVFFHFPTLKGERGCWHEFSSYYDHNFTFLHVFQLKLSKVVVQSCLFDVFNVP